MTKNLYTTKSDVWSFGVLMHEILSYGENPYVDLKNAEVPIFLAKGNRLPCPIGCPEHLYKVLTDCWKSTAIDRPRYFVPASPPIQFVLSTPLVNFFFHYYPDVVSRRWHFCWMICLRRVTSFLFLIYIYFISQS